jgi:hypothetical protein
LLFTFPDEYRELPLSRPCRALSRCSRVYVYRLRAGAGYSVFNPQDAVVSDQLRDGQMARLTG